MLYRPVECVTGMDRDCGSILKIWDVARFLKLNCAPFWTAMEDTHIVREANAFGLSRPLNPPAALSFLWKDGTGTVGNRLHGC
ncbi:hypothetical protein Gotur_016009 [Gossypium turneri]